MGQTQADNPADATRREWVNLIYAISHDFGAHVRHVHQFSRLLVECLGDDVTDEQREFVAIVENSAERMSLMLNRLLLLSRLYTRPGARMQLNIGDLAADMIEHLCAEWQGSEELTINIKGRADVVIANEYAKIILEELLHNALNAVAKSERPEIILSLANDGESFSITVEDSGPGFIGSFIERATHFFSVGEHGKKTAGMGLPLVNHIAKIIGGRLTIRNRTTQGAVITLTAPSNLDCE